VEGWLVSLSARGKGPWEDFHSVGEAAGLCQQPRPILAWRRTHPSPQPY
jgi:hypothetical protein